MHFCPGTMTTHAESINSDLQCVKMSIRSKEMGGYVGVKCKQKGVNGRLSEQRSGMSHMKCKQKGVNGKW